jgi:hypothetical protein
MASALLRDKKFAALALVAGTVVGLVCYHYANTSDGALSADQAAAVSEAELCGARRLLPAEAAEASAMLARALVDDPLVLACANPAFSRDARLGPLAQMYRVVLKAVLPSAQGFVVLTDSKTRGAAAVWQPPGAFPSLPPPPFPHTFLPLPIARTLPTQPSPNRASPSAPPPPSPPSPRTPPPVSAAAS